MRRESLLVGCALIGTLTLFSGCRTAQKSNEKQILTKIESNADESASENKTSKQNVLGEPTGSMALSYAENFSVDYYGDYTLLKTKDGTQILTVPEDKDIPDNLDEDIVVLKQPVDGIYLVSSAVMDMFRELGASNFLARRQKIGILMRQKRQWSKEKCSMLVNTAALITNC